MFARLCLRRARVLLLASALVALTPLLAVASSEADPTPPVTTAALSPVGNAAGWTKTAVTVTLTATDSGNPASGVRSITYWATGAHPIARTTVSAAQAVLPAISTDGITRVRYFARDHANNTAATTITLVKVDGALPTTTAPIFFFNSQQNINGSVATNLNWDAYDNEGGSGVLRTTLQRSIDGAAFTNVALDTVNASAKSLNLSADHSHQFQTRARDVAGNVSATVTGEFALGVPVFIDVAQENDAALVYTGNWANETPGSAFGGALKRSASNGSSVTYTFTGTAFMIVGTRGPARGLAQATLDGEPSGPIIDLYSPTTIARTGIYAGAGLVDTTHTLTLTVLGDMNPASTGRRVDFDGIIIQDPQ